MSETTSHDFDDDGVCIICGFDGAEWWHWKKKTYEGRASDAQSPPCKYIETAAQLLAEVTK